MNVPISAPLHRYLFLSRRLPLHSHVHLYLRIHLHIRLFLPLRTRHRHQPGHQPLLSPCCRIPLTLRHLHC